jgi:ComF family protein
MLKGFLSLFLKSNCPLCQRPAESIICPDCTRRVESCQLANPSQFWKGDLPLFVWGHYESQLKRAIAAFKYENHVELGEFFGYSLGENWLKCNLLKKFPQLTVIPVPLHAEKQEERGFNQALEIARVLCAEQAQKLDFDSVQRQKHRPAQVSLSWQARLKNIKGVFKLQSASRKTVQRIAILDDVMTTGASLNELAKTLKQAGASHVECWIVARTLVRP